MGCIRMSSGRESRGRISRKRILQASECPVAKQAQRTQSSAEALANSLKQLRRMMRRCRNCAAVFDCPAMIEFNRAFRIALEEINAEWDEGAGV